MDKQSVVYPYNEILFSHKKSVIVGYHMDEPWKYYELENIYIVKEGSHKRPYIIWFHLYEVSKIGESLETVNR